ncbi:hypothetical protein ACRALDRAFT_2028731 [Sodiomyces alcalophilus JCM 7366]|uniref:uncharacterized protein n=1 Tax=Sodiomyces alcalophilus JCM 7366 TaxID=591952 RepID=UPI0039B5B8D4
MSPELLAVLGFESIPELGRAPQNTVQDLLSKHKQRNTITDQNVLTIYSEWLAEQIPRLRLKASTHRPPEIRRWCDFISTFRISKCNVLGEFKQLMKSRKVTDKSLQQAWRYAIRNIEIDYKVPAQACENRARRGASQKHKKSRTAPESPAVVTPTGTASTSGMAAASQTCTAPIPSSGGVGLQRSVADGWVPEAWMANSGYGLFGFGFDRGRTTPVHSSSSGAGLSPNYPQRPMSTVSHSPGQGTTELPSPSMPRTQLTGLSCLPF